MAEDILMTITNKKQTWTGHNISKSDENGQSNGQTTQELYKSMWTEDHKET